MECMSFSRLFMAVTLILIYVIQKLVGLAHQASPVNLKPLHEDMDVRHLAFEDQLQFIDSDEYKTDKLLSDIQLDSVSVSYLSVSVLLFELNERQGCLGAANYSVIRTFSAVNVGQMVLQIRGFKIGSSSSASNILRGRLYNYAKSKTQQQAASTTSDHKHSPHYHHNNHNHQQQQNQQQSICHGYGFTIHDCEPFDLEPNREHKIRIAFNPDFTLTKTIVSLTILTNLDEEFKFALVASMPRNLLATCNQSLPRPDWEPTMHLILAFGMVIMILVSILTAYMEAMLYIKSQQTTSAQTNNSQSVTQSNHHNGGNSKDCNNYSNHTTDTCNKDRNNGSSGHGAAAAAISAPISSHQQSSSLPYNALANGKNNNFTLNTGGKKDTTNNNNNNGNKGHNNCTQKRRKNSSTANSEKVPTANNKSIGSSINDKKSSNPYVPIFQNLTNVIASPPPPLPTFDNEFASLEFKKLRSKKSAKKSNSLNGSIASSDDIGNPSSLNQGQSVVPGKNKSNGKANGLKTSASNSINGERDIDIQTQLSRGSRESSSNRKGSLKDAFTTTTLADKETRSTDSKLFNEATVDINHQEQPTVMPIQPPSTFSSTPYSSTTSSTSTSTSSSSSSASSSPPLSQSSYGEYSLLGPGATFELPCLRVRSAQI